MTANGGRHRAGDGATLGLAELDEAIALTIRVHSELIRTRELLGEDTPKPGLIEGPDGLFRPTGYPVSEAEYEEAAERWRSAYANGTAKPFFTPEPSPVIDDLTDDEINSFHDAVAGRDLSERLAPYRVPPTVDVPRDVVCAVLEAVARCDLSMVKPLLGDLGSAITLRDDPEQSFRRMAHIRAIDSLLARLCDLIAAEKVWPRQAAHNRRDHIYHGGAVVSEQPEQPWWPWPEWATDDLQRQLHQLHLPIIGTVPSFDEAHHRTDRATARFILRGLVDSGWQLSRVTSTTSIGPGRPPTTGATTSTTGGQS